MTPAFESPSVTLYTGHVLEVLAGLPAESIQCVVTSPPYWSLRSYSLEPVVWDTEFGCKHEWGEAKAPATELGAGGNTNGIEAVGAFDPGKVHATASKPETSAFCLRCGAWHGSLGLEPTPQLYVRHLVSVFREVRRVLRSDGVCFLNLGDSYAGGGGLYPNAPSNLAGSLQSTGHSRQKGGAPVVDGLKPKDLVGIPWRVALALQEDGWWLRADIIWAKPNPMPESVTDRPTRSHEYIFLLTKSERYFWDQEAVREPHHPDGRKATAAPLTEHGRENYAGADGHERWPNGGRNLRSVWAIATQPMNLEWCKGCGKVYGRAEYAYLRRGSVARCQSVIDEDTDEKCGGTDWAFEGDHGAQPGDANGSGVVTCQDCEANFSLEEHRKLPRTKLCNRCKGDQWGSHFATFPEELVRRCVLAGTSERGCCPECGAPWERMVDKQSVYEGARRHDDLEKRGLTQGSGWKGGPEASPVVTTTGWQQTCAHTSLAPAPCLILDPFVGSGTVALVAQKLGRRAIGIDLSAPYLDLAKARLDEVPLPMKERT